MDLLGSIMGSMTAPPAMSQKEKDKRKKMREMQKKVSDGMGHDSLFEALKYLFELAHYLRIFATRGALHKIGRFQNVPTVGTFVNKFIFNFINKRTYGRYVSETTYFM